MSKVSKSIAYNYLSGNCGLKVSNICLGTGNFGKSGIQNPGGLLSSSDSVAILNRFTELGGNFIDTANNYSAGQSETIIGDWLSQRSRDDLVIATKCRFPTNFVPRHHNDIGLSRKNILIEVEASLKRLKTDYIDLYQTHCWDAGTPLEETLATLNDLVRSGKVRYVGGCNLLGWQIQKIVDINKSMGFHQFVTLQQQYNLLTRMSELESFEVCKNEGLGVLPWSPLHGGLLTGKFVRGMTAPPEGTRVAWATNAEKRVSQLRLEFDLYANNNEYWKLRDVMDAAAKKHGKSAAQVGLRWLLQKQPVTSVIIGTTSLKQLEDNIGASTGWKLTNEDMQDLDKASRIKLTYPYFMVERQNRERKRNYFDSKY